MKTILLILGIAGVAAFFLWKKYFKKDPSVKRNRRPIKSTAPDKLENAYERLLRTSSLTELKQALKNGIDINAPLANGYTLLMTAAKIGSNVSIIRFLVESGADIHICSRTHHTVLMLAAANTTDGTVLKYLLQCGADKTAVSDSGKTAFDYAQSNKALKEADRMILKV